MNAGTYRICIACISFISHSIYSYPAGREIGLKEIENMALSNLFELKTLRDEIEIRNEIKNAKIRDFFPSASVTYSRNRSIVQRDDDRTGNTVKLTLSQPVFDSGRKKMSLEISRLNLESAKIKYRMEKNNVLFQIRRLYMNIQEKREVSKILNLNFQNADELLRHAEKKINLGLISPIEYLEIKNEYENRKLSLRSALHDEEDAVTELINFLNPGSSLPDIKHVDFDSITFRPLDGDERIYYLTARKQNPDLRMKKIQTLQSRKEFLIEKASFLPSIAVVGYYAKNGERWPPENTEIGMGIHLSFSAAGSSVRHHTDYISSRNDISRSYSTDSTLNIYDNPLWKKDIMEKKLSLKRSVINERRTENILEYSIHRLHRILSETGERLKISGEAAEILKRRFDSEKQKYRLGEISLHDYFREETALNDARLKFIQEKIKFITAADSLEKEMGLEPESLGLYGMKELTTKELEEYRNE